MVNIEAITARLEVLAREHGERLVVINPAPGGAGVFAAFQGTEDELGLGPTGRFSAKARNEANALSSLLQMATTAR